MKLWARDFYFVIVDGEAALKSTTTRSISPVGDMWYASAITHRNREQINLSVAIVFV